MSEYDLSCPACGFPGPPKFLGSLGNLMWVRCPACGMDHSHYIESDLFDQEPFEEEPA